MISTNLLFYIITYLLASIPFGYILAKLFAHVDIKQSGSGNIGATNVLRVVKEKDPSLAKKLGAATLALDALKGAVMILIGRAFGLDESILWSIAVLAVVGHCFSIFLAFEGGKGVATGIGVLAAMAPLQALVAIGVWFVGAKLLKISSLSSLMGLVAFIAAMYLTHPIAQMSAVWLITIIIFYKHIPNILRLIRNEEKPV